MCDVMTYRLWRHIALALLEGSPDHVRVCTDRMAALGMDSVEMAGMIRVSAKRWNCGGGSGRIDPDRACGMWEKLLRRVNA